MMAKKVWVRMMEGKTEAPAGFMFYELSKKRRDSCVERID